MNNKGFGKFESLTIFVVIIMLLAGGLYLILNMTDKTKYEAMNNNSIAFVKSLSGSDVAFLTYRSYYLQQAVDEGIIKNINSPFSKGNCDNYESRVDLDEDKYYVTLKCGDYLIKNKESSMKEFKVYKVGEWSDARTNKDDDTRTIYSCADCGVDGYYEEPVFVYLYNKNNNTSYNYLDDVKKKVEVTSKEQFRTMELAFES